MKKFCFFGIMSLLAFGGCKEKECIDGDEFPKGNIRELPPFHSVKVQLSATIELIHDTASNVPFVELITEQNVLTHLSTQVWNDTLNIKLGFCFSSLADITVKVHYDSLSTLIIDGPGDIISGKLMHQQKLVLLNRSTGDFDLTLDVNELQSKITHTGNIFLSGQVGAHSVIQNGSGNLNSYEAMTDTLILESKNSGNAWVRVKNRMEAILSGSGDVYYKGFPMLDTLSTSTGKFINDN